MGIRYTYGVLLHTYTRSTYEFEAQAGIEPANSGFADRRVSHFTTGPLSLIFLSLQDSNA